MTDFTTNDTNLLYHKGSCVEDKSWLITPSKQQTMWLLHYTLPLRNRHVKKGILNVKLKERSMLNSCNGEKESKPYWLDVRTYHYNPTQKSE
jgi:hypothetical protein